MSLQLMRVNCSDTNCNEINKYDNLDCSNVTHFPLGRNILTIHEIFNCQNIYDWNCYVCYCLLNAERIQRADWEWERKEEIHWAEQRKRVHEKSVSCWNLGRYLSSLIQCAIYSIR